MKLSDKEMYELGLEVVSGMKASSYGVSLEVGRDYALEYTVGDSVLEKHERKRLGEQIAFIAKVVIDKLNEMGK